MDNRLLYNFRFDPKLKKSPFIRSKYGQLNEPEHLQFLEIRNQHLSGRKQRIRTDRRTRTQEYELNRIQNKRLLSRCFHYISFELINQFLRYSRLYSIFWWIPFSRIFLRQYSESLRSCIALGQALPISHFKLLRFFG